MVSGSLILSVLEDSMEGILGDLGTSLQHFYKKKRREKLP